jgi:hypothetical protein
LGIEGTLSSMGISKSEQSEASAAPSAPACGLARNTPSGLLVGPRRRALSGTMRRRRTVACRLRVNPVSLLMISVRTPCDMSRRANSVRRFSRRMGSSEISGHIDSPRSQGCNFSEKAAKCSYQLIARRCTLHVPFGRHGFGARSGRVTQSSNDPEPVGRCEGVADGAPFERTLLLSACGNGSRGGRAQRAARDVRSARALGQSGCACLRACWALPRIAAGPELSGPGLLEVGRRRQCDCVERQRIVRIFQDGARDPAPARDSDGGLEHLSLCPACGDSYLRDGVACERGDCKSLRARTRSSGSGKCAISATPVGREPCLLATTAIGSDRLGR